MQAFEPASDEQIFGTCRDLPVPYRVGVPCIHCYAVSDQQEQPRIARSAGIRPGSDPGLKTTVAEPRPRVG